MFVLLESSAVPSPDRLSQDILWSYNMMVEGSIISAMRHCWCCWSIPRGVCLFFICKETADGVMDTRYEVLENTEWDPTYLVVFNQSHAILMRVFGCYERGCASTRLAR